MWEYPRKWQGVIFLKFRAVGGLRALTVGALEKRVLQCKKVLEEDTLLQQMSWCSVGKQLCQCGVTF